VRRLDLVAAHKQQEGKRREPSPHGSPEHQRGRVEEAQAAGAVEQEGASDARQRAKRERQSDLHDRLPPELRSLQGGRADSPIEFRGNGLRRPTLQLDPKLLVGPH